MTWFENEIAWTVWTWPVVLTAVSVWLWRMALRFAPEIRIGLLVFGGFYIVTTLIGGVAIGVTDGVALEWLECGLDIRPLINVGSMSYWLMLYAPLILPVSLFLLFRDFQLVNEVIEFTLPRENVLIRPSGYLSVFGLFTGYCLAVLTWKGKLLAITTWQTAQSDYLGMISLRIDLAEQLGGPFFGIIYIALPTLSFIAVHQAVMTKLISWKIITLLSVAVIGFINLSVMHKSPLILYLAFLTLALLDLGVIKWRTVAAAGMGLVAVVTVLQSLMLEQWTFGQSFTLIIFRMASSFPYYLSLYPELLPFEGIETGLHLFGIGQPVQDSSLVLQYMYPALQSKGNAAAPLHLRAYSQAGYIFAALNLAVICLPLKAASLLHRRRKSSLAFALYMGLLLELYFATQTSLREALLSCYGFFWVVVAVATALMASYSPPAPQQKITSPRQSLKTRPAVRRPASRAHPAALNAARQG